MSFKFAASFIVVVSDGKMEMGEDDPKIIGENVYAQDELECFDFSEITSDGETLSDGTYSCFVFGNYWFEEQCAMDGTDYDTEVETDYLSRKKISDCRRE